MNKLITCFIDFSEPTAPSTCIKSIHSALKKEHREEQIIQEAPPSSRETSYQENLKVLIHENITSIDAQRLQQVTVQPRTQNTRRLQQKYHNYCLNALAIANTPYRNNQTVEMDESNLLSRTGRKLRKSLKAFRIHLKRVETRTPAKSRINDRSSTLTDLTNLQRISRTHNSRIRALNKHGLHLRERSLQRMLAEQLRRRPTIGVETSTWRVKRAMSEVEQELKREAVALQGIERALLTALQCLVRNYRFLRGISRSPMFDLGVRLVAAADILQRGIETGKLALQLESEVREHLRVIGSQVGNARAFNGEIRRAVLELARDASRQGVKVARQTLLDEYF